jgi:hypothetical protein
MPTEAQAVVGAGYRYGKEGGQLKVAELVTIFNKVSGLEENQAKTAIYYAIATHKLDKFSWFPALAFIGAPGTGKSKAIDLLRQLCFKPCPITCHPTMTSVAMRDELAAAINKTAVIEEVDLYSNRKQLQGYLINRVDKIRTSGVAVKEQTETESGLKKWRTHKKRVFGATIIHDRHSIEDMAAESRVIVIATVFKEGDYIEPPKVSLPDFKLSPAPDYFVSSGRALDTWKPLIMVASGLQDTDWLIWAWQQIEEATNELKDGQIYEEKLAIFSKVIEAYYDNGLDKLIVREPLRLKSVTEALQREGMLYVSPQVIKKTLTAMGFKVQVYGGSNKLFTTEEQLRKVANDIGYQDECLK